MRYGGKYPGGMEKSGRIEFHNENGSPMTKRHLNPCQYMPRVQERLTELSVVLFSGLGN